MKINNRKLFLSLFTGFCGLWNVKAEENTEVNIKKTTTRYSKRYQVSEDDDTDTISKNKAKVEIKTNSKQQTSSSKKNNNSTNLIVEIQNAVVKTELSCSTEQDKSLALSGSVKVKGYTVYWGKILVDTLSRIKGPTRYSENDIIDNAYTEINAKNGFKYYAKLSNQDMSVIMTETFNNVFIKSGSPEDKKPEFYDKIVDEYSRDIYNNKLIGTLLTYFSYKGDYLELGSDVTTKVDDLGSDPVADAFKVGGENNKSNYNEDAAIGYQYAMNKKKSALVGVKLFQKLHFYEKGINHLGRSMLDASALMFDLIYKFDKPQKTALGLQFITNPSTNSKMGELKDNEDYNIDKLDYSTAWQLLSALFATCYEHSISLGFDSKYEDKQSKDKDGKESDKWNVSNYISDMKLLLISNKTKQHKVFFGIKLSINGKKKEELEKAYADWSKAVEGIKENHIKLKMAHTKDVMKKIASYILSMDVKYEYVLENGAKATLKIASPDLFFVNSKDKTLSQTEGWNPFARDFITNLMNISFKISKTFNEKPKNLKKDEKSGALLTL